MAVTVNDFKTAFRVDGTDDDTLITGYISAAKNFIQNAIGEDSDAKFYSDDRVSALFDTATLSLAGTYYTYRVALTDVANTAIDLTLNSIIGQLRSLYASIYDD